jgi:hypothetical protein
MIGTRLGPYEGVAPLSLRGAAELERPAEKGGSDEGA